MLSVRGLEWVARERKDVQIPGIPAELASIVANRGITDFQEFFRPTLKGSMPDPFELKSMREAVDRVADGVVKAERICILGDYDVDGATSTAMLLRFLRAMGNEVSFYIPDRLTEGYGPNVEAVKQIASTGVTLLIVADSGSVAFAPMEEAARLGMTSVILDHHMPKAEHPEGILVNPNRLDESGDYGYLCTAGLAFLFLVGLQRSLRERGWFSDGREEYDLKDLLGLAALGTVADVMKLRGLNRAYVRLGIKMMSRNKGLMALAAACEIDEANFSTHTCGFVFGPAINAGGRIDDTKWGTKLLSSDDDAEVAEIARKLVEINRERQGIQAEIVEQAEEQARKQSDRKVIIAYDESWHPGVVGIVASRLKDGHDKSAIVIGKEGKGSARSVDGFDIGGAIIAAVEAGILLKGGGHPPAGGLTIDPSRLGELVEFMEARAQALVRPALQADLVLDCGKVLVPQIESFEMLAPFGPGNSEPRAILCNGTLRYAKKIKERHVKAVLKNDAGSIDVILFNCVGQPLGDALLAAEGMPVELYGKIKVNEYLGKRKPQIIPEDVRVLRDIC